MSKAFANVYIYIYIYIPDIVLMSKAFANVYHIYIYIIYRTLS